MEGVYDRVIMMCNQFIGSQEYDDANGRVIKREDFERLDMSWVRFFILYLGSEPFLGHVSLIDSSI